MNVPVAFAADPYGFWWVIGLSAIGTLATILFFKKQRMF